MSNHVIDPSFFYDAIEQFAFDYGAYICDKFDVDDYGRRISSFTKLTIRGSLQTQGDRLKQSKDGNTHEVNYKFYCKSLYRINVDDFIFYDNKWLHVDSIHQYDEYGVRECSLTMVQLSSYRDLADYVKYLEGEKIV